MTNLLTITCSNMDPMPEVFGGVGTYFDPEDANCIAKTLPELIDWPDLQAQRAKATFNRAQAFTWTWCASGTFGLLSKIAQKYQ